MVNYKKQYNKLKVEYDIIKRGSGNKSTKNNIQPSELFETLQELYINKLDRMDDQQHILSKQVNILNQKDKQIDDNEDVIKDNTTKIQTKQRKTTYGQQNDDYSKLYIKICNAILVILGVILLFIIWKLVQKYRNNV